MPVRGVASNSEQFWAGMLAAAPPHMIQAAWAGLHGQESSSAEAASASSAMVARRAQEERVVATSVQRTHHQATASVGSRTTEVDLHKDPQNGWEPEIQEAGEGKEAEQPYVREQDRFLPIANIAKLMARQLAHMGYAKISHDAKKLMQENVT